MPTSLRRMDMNTGYGMNTGTEHNNFLKNRTRGHGDVTLEYAYK